MAVQTWRYNRAGRLLRYARYDASGALVEDDVGVAGREQTWTRSGLLQRLRHFDGDGEDTPGPDGCAVVETTYDDAGEVAEARCDGVVQAEEGAP